MTLAKFILNGPQGPVPPIVVKSVLVSWAHVTSDSHQYLRLYANYKPDFEKLSWMNHRVRYLPYRKSKWMRRVLKYRPGRYYFLLVLIITPENMSAKFKFLNFLKTQITNCFLDNNTPPTDINSLTLHDALPINNTTKNYRHRSTGSGNSHISQISNLVLWQLEKFDRGPSR